MFYPHTPFAKQPDVQSQLFERNKEIIKSLCQWLCTPPKSTTYRINLLLVDSNTIQAEIHGELSKKYLYPPAIHTSPEIPELICISKLPSFENSIVCPTSDLGEVIVDTSCGASVLRGAHIYAPGVIAMQSGNFDGIFSDSNIAYHALGARVGDEVNVYSDVEGKCRKGTNTVYQSASKTFLGIGTLKMVRYHLFGQNMQPRGVAVEMHSVISGVPSIGDLSSPRLLLQNAPSIVCCRVLDPQPEETILDMCAAPGNKTTHISELMNDSGILIALDKTTSKIKLVRDKLQEKNLKSVKCFVFDSTQALSIDSIASDILNGPPFSRQSFDRILLDAPCSALGNRPLLRCDLNLKMLQSYPKVQKKLLKVAVGLLKQGGILVYSTCTITESENEGMVRWTLDTFREMKLVDSKPRFGGKGLEQSELSRNERDLVQRFGPDCTDVRFDSVGFFIAKFQKI